MSIQVSEKICPDCERIKPLSDFYKDAGTSDGRSTYCADCTKQRVYKAQQRRREEMGEEAWLKHRRQVVARRREKMKAETGTVRAPYEIAYDKATARLRELHQDDFRKLLNEERYKLGLDPL